MRMPNTPSEHMPLLYYSQFTWSLEQLVSLNIINLYPLQLSLMQMPNTPPVHMPVLYSTHITWSLEQLVLLNIIFFCLNIMNLYPCISQL